MTLLKKVNGSWISISGSWQPRVNDIWLGLPGSWQQRVNHIWLGLYTRLLKRKFHEIKRNARVTVNNNFLGHKWGDLPIIFTSDEITSENLWQIASRMTQKLLFEVTNVSFYFLHDISCNEHTIQRKKRKNDFAIITKDYLLWSSIVTSVDLWRHANVGYWHCDVIFLLAQIGAKAIFISE